MQSASRILAVCQQTAKPRVTFENQGQAFPYCDYRAAIRMVPRTAVKPLLKKGPPVNTGGVKYREQIIQTPLRAASNKPLKGQSSLRSSRRLD